MGRRKADTLYGGPDDENLDAETPEEYLDGLFADDMEGRAVEVVEYRRKKLAKADFKAAVHCAFEGIQERLEEEYAGDGDIGLEDCEEAWVRAATASLWRLAKKHVRVWRCEPVGSTTWKLVGGKWAHAKEGGNG